MSGPVTAADDGPEVSAPPRPEAPGVEVLESRTTDVGGITVRRALPRRRRRTIGAWCFVDHLGPAGAATAPMQVGPHPHIGLQTVTWLLSGEALHRDSLGSEQVIRPGALNLMTAGDGVAHAEESPSATRDDLHGAQLWVAQPEATRHGPAAFEHHGELPAVDVGTAVATVLVGDLLGARSPARRDTPLLGVALDVRPGVVALPLEPSFEHGLVVLDGAVAVAGRRAAPGALAYLGPGRDEVELQAREPARALLLGGEPFGEELVMWWNFVGRDRAEIDRAWRDWEQGSERFGRVRSGLGRIPAPRPSWMRPG